MYRTGVDEWNKLCEVVIRKNIKKFKRQYEGKERLADKAI